MRRDAGATFVYAVVVVGGVLDAHLIRHERSPITATLRRPVPLALLTFLTLHAWNVLGPWDPFRYVAKRLVRVPALS